MRRNSTDPEYVFIAHISGMDAMARALENAAAIIEDGTLCNMVKERYASFDAGMLGSIDANRGDAQNGWDTDQFPIDNFELTQAMLEIIRNGGLGNGGTNFDAKIRRNSTDLEDLFIAHISGMDAMARALMNAAAILEESELPAMKKARYASFDQGIGKEFEDGKLTLEQVYEYGKKVGEPKQTSGKQEKYETIVALYSK
jgi:xylose isomerase